MNYLLISTPLTAKTALKALSVRQAPYPNRTTVASPTTDVHLRVPYSTLVTTHSYHYDLSSDSAVQSMHDPFTAQLFRPTLLDIRHFRSVRCHPRIYGHCCASVGALSEQRVSLLSARVGYNRRLIRDCRRLPQRSAALASEVLYFVRTDGGMSIENHRHRDRLDDSSLEYDLTNGMIKVNKILKLSVSKLKIVKSDNKRSEGSLHKKCRIHLK